MLQSSGMLWDIYHTTIDFDAGIAPEVPRSALSKRRSDAWVTADSPSISRAPLTIASTGGMNSCAEGLDELMI
jgi:hypothetical protein